MVNAGVTDGPISIDEAFSSGEDHAVDERVRHCKVAPLYV